jgi:hypothetical protein
MRQLPARRGIDRESFRLDLGIAACVIEIGDQHPFAMPALLVAWNHALGSAKTFRHRPAAFRRFAERTAKLVAHPWMLRPMMPTERLIMRIAARGHLVDEQLFGHCCSIQQFQSVPIPLFATLWMRIGGIKGHHKSVILVNVRWQRNGTCSRARSDEAIGNAL